MNDTSRDKATPTERARRQVFELLLGERDIALHSLPAIPKRNAATPMPASVTQKRLWDDWISGLPPESQCETVVLRLTGPANIQALGDALDEVVRRHDILRASFVEVDGELYQAISRHMRMRLSIVDLALLSPDQGEAEWRRICEVQTGIRFDLRLAPLMRWMVVPLTSEDQRIVVTLHRAICDDWSADVLVDELLTFYDTYFNGTPGQLEEPVLQYADYVAWERERLEAGELDSVMDYWREQFAEGPSAGQRAASGKPIRQHPERISSPIRLSGEVSGQIGGFCAQHVLTPYIFFLACCNILLGRRKGLSEVCIGAVTANRNEADVQFLVGPLAGILMIKVDVSGNPTFEEVISGARQSALTAYEHQGLAYARVLTEALRSGRPGTPEMGLVLSEGSVRRYRSGNLNIMRERGMYRTEGADLAIVLWSADGGFEGQVSCADVAPGSNHAQRLANEFERLVHACVSDPQRRIGDLEPLAD
jgi:hypothetical protein